MTDHTCRNCGKKIDVAKRRRRLPVYCSKACSKEGMFKSERHEQPKPIPKNFVRWKNANGY